MCGVATVLKKKPLNKKEKNIFIEIMKQSSIRGLHSFGFAHIEKNKIKIKKFHYIEKAIQYFENKISDDFIYHNRYSTSGDWKNHKNNQPISYKNNALVFNGVISMKQKHEMEKEFNIKMNQDNDGEIFLQNIKNPMKFLKNNKISFAGLYFKKGEIEVVRNNLRPLWYSIQSEAVFIASTKDILKRSGVKNTHSVRPNIIHKIGCFFEQKKRLHKISYRNDEQWGYRPSKQLPALHCE